ncbi:MAG: hypothetical protein ACMXYF_05185 [Candidatus Woesearchaeota archaeon]
MKIYTLLLVLAIFIVACSPQNGMGETPTTEQPMEIRDTRTQEEITEEILEQLLEDGQYTDSVTYLYHSGEETVDISITVESDVVTQVSITESDDAHPTSSRLIRGVDTSLQDLAVGKNIRELTDLPDQIAGSSLTVAAFKQYVNELIE